MKAFGIYAGIGSPLIAARNAGFEIVGNFDSRSLAHYKDDEGRNTFIENFPGASLYKKWEYDILNLQDIDLLCGHPKCGNYSGLINKTGAERVEHSQRRSDQFDMFITAIAQIKPKFFFIDNLPKSLIGNPISRFSHYLPEYDLFPEFVSNFHYGNPQKNRNRYFIIGARRELNFVFRPGEQPNEDNKTVFDCLKDLEKNWGEVPNHDQHSKTAKSNSGRRFFHDDVMTWGEIIYFFQTEKHKALAYRQKETGEIKYHFGFRPMHWARPAPTLIGTHPQLHPGTFLPPSIRERARLMGFPDDFIFYGTKYEDDRTWIHNRNTNMIQQTGRAIPIQFPTYLCEQFAAHLQGKIFDTSNQRMIKPNVLVTEAKIWLYRKHGYSNLNKVIRHCWTNYKILL